MKRILYSVLLIGIQFLSGQELDSVLPVERITENKEVSKIDSLWMQKLYRSSIIDSVFTSININDIERDTIAKWNEISTDTLKARLAVLNSKTPFHIEYNPELERLIKRYLKYRRKYYPTMMARAAYYFPLIEKELAKREIPLEMKYLAVIESALKPKAVSGVGATGLWQFMYQTGKMYNLNLSSYVDERQDPIKATKAACNYLEDLYHTFNDWDLALAAYNSGPGNVSKAIRRSGNHINYWNIRSFLPRETANYVPAFYATLYIFEYAKEHELYKEKPLITGFEVDTIRPKQLITFQQIHDQIGTDIELIEFLNPSYKLNIIPKVENRDYPLILPIKDALKFVSKEDQIDAYLTEESNKREKPLPKYFEMNQRIRYKVRSGEYLGLIAEKHGVYVRDIIKWNGLRSSSLRVGQRLTIYPKRLNYNVAKTSSSKPKITPKKVEIPSGAKKLWHSISQGDNLWDIAKKYGVTITQLRGWNNLWNDNNLKLGNRLVIYRKP